MSVAPDSFPLYRDNNDIQDHDRDPKETANRSLNKSFNGNNNDSLPSTTRTTILPIQYYPENSPTDNQRNDSIVKNNKKSVKKYIILILVAILIVAIIGIIIFVIIRTRRGADEQLSELNQTSTDSISTSTIVAQQPTKKALFIIVDGISADTIENISLINIRKIEEIGAYTRAYVGGDNGTYTETITISAPGYMCLLTGTWGNKHNVSDNGVINANYHYKNIFRLVKEQQSNKKIGIFSTWISNRLKLIGEGLLEAGNITFDYKFDGYDLDESLYPHDPEALFIKHIDQRVTNDTAQCIETDAPDLSWVYLQYTDDVGHSFGDSEQLNQAVIEKDNQIGQIWEAIEYRMKHHNEEWLLIVTTDHGRDPITGHEHGEQTDRERTTWIVTNSQETNTYFRDFQPGIVDILPTIARFMDVAIPIESERELDGIPLIGKVSLIKPYVSLNTDSLTISWTVIDPVGDVIIWLSTTNLFENGMTDDYKLMGKVPIDNKMAIIDIKEYPSKFYKIVLEGQYNMVNKWVFST